MEFKHQNMAAALPIIWELSYSFVFKRGLIFSQCWPKYNLPCVKKTYHDFAAVFVVYFWEGTHGQFESIKIKQAAALFFCAPSVLFSTVCFLVFSVK